MFSSKRGRAPVSAILPSLLATTLLSGLAHAADGEASPDKTSVDSVTIKAAKQTYNAGSSQGATKLPLSLRETPQSVTVVTRQRMDDFGLNSIANVLEQTTGITVQELDSSRVGFTSRGFSVANFQLDGVPTTYSSGSSVMSDTIIYDRVEVMRGATGLVTGSGDPSATVNLVRKRPTQTFSAAVGLTGGSWNLKRADLDISGPLLAGGRVRGRLVGLAQERDSYLDFFHEKKKAAYGVVEADVTSSTVARVGYDYQKVTPRGTTWGTAPLYYRDGTPTDLPRSYNVAAKWSTWDRNTANLFATVEQRLPGDWRLTASVNRRTTNSTAKLFYGYGGYPSRVDGSGLTVADYYNVYQEKETGFDVSAVGPFTLFGRKHELVFGANGYDRDGETLNDKIDAANRPYSLTIPNFRTWTGDIPEPVLLKYGTRASVARTDETGVYGAVRLNPTDSLKIIVGARKSNWETRTDRYSLAGVYTNTTGAYKAERLTPYVGAIWDLTSQISAYASYSDLFKPQNYKDKANELLDPVVGSNYEGGLKGEFLDKKLYGAVSVFYVKQDNLAELDPTAPAGFLLPDGGSAYRGVSGAVTRGFEAEVTGQITDAWRIVGGYTYAYTENAKGLRISTLDPRNIARIYTTYTLGGGPLAGLTVGGGINWQSGIYTTATIPTSTTTTKSTTVRQSAYALANLMARYRISEQLSVSANVDNLFDQNYYRRVGFYNGGYFGEPRRVTVALRASF